MSLTRHQQIKRFLHVANSAAEPKRASTHYDALFNVQPLLDIFLVKCKDLYVPGKQLSLDEMDVSFKGHSAHKSGINYKHARDGFLVYTFLILALLTGGVVIFS